MGHGTTASGIRDRSMIEVPITTLEPGFERSSGLTSVVQESTIRRKERNRHGVPTRLERIERPPHSRESFL
jgi:hypothetical protein